MHLFLCTLFTSWNWVWMAPHLWEEWAERPRRIQGADGGGGGGVMILRYHQPLRPPTHNGHFDRGERERLRRGHNGPFFLEKVPPPPPIGFVQPALPPPSDFTCHRYDGFICSTGAIHPVELSRGALSTARGRDGSNHCGDEPGGWRSTIKRQLLTPFCYSKEKTQQGNGHSNSITFSFIVF